MAQIIALGAGIGGAPLVMAQSTTGTLVGQVASHAGDTVLIRSTSGISRTVPVDARGRYVASQLPLGAYTVSLQQNGKTVDSRDNVTLHVGTATNVSFSAPGTSDNATALTAVNVTGSSLPAIDVTSVDSRTVVTADQLAKLPLGRSAEAIAQLAPGVNRNTANFTSATGQALVSFGGSAASENAYYINGFNTTDPLNAAGGLTLPYGAIDQQEVYTGGYSAQYGRSDGGVINQVGKRGTNDWHFGTQVIWEPSFARSDYTDIHYANGTPNTPIAGDLFDPKSQNKLSNTTVSAYAGGPLIKDKLFFFLAGEFEREQGKSVNSVDSSSTPYQSYRYADPRWYGKLDWNINDSNILELTGASDKREGSGSVYKYDYTSRTRGAFTRPLDNTKTGGDLYVAKYTGYLTDNLTVSAMYGELTTTNYDSPGNYNDSLTYVSGVTRQNPALNDGVPRSNSQIGSLADPRRGNKTTNTRFDVSYHLGDHTLSAGIDNQKAEARYQGTRNTGPGYVWVYGHTDHPDQPLVSGSGVPATQDFPNGQDGYYVQQNIDNNAVSVRSQQKAQYIEDKWQVSDRWLLSLGLRNDQFTDYNSGGQPFITQTRPQWAPRLGFSWDVNGDSSFKVFGNAGRYYLGLPLNPATGAASGYVSTQQYFTYAGIAADGTPTGLTVMSNPVSANNSFGTPPDPSTVTANNIKAEYQDEFILGFTKTAGSDWLYGAKLTQRTLRTAIDDFCDIARVSAKAESLGYNLADGSTNSCYLINPGRANTFNLHDAAGHPISVTLSNAELGFPQLKRRYYSLETFVEHPFDGTWFGRINYTFSRSYGNTEGQLRSDLLQSGASASEDWDNAVIMENTNGPQNNDHTHQIRAFGYYQISPEWLASANLSVQSGNPRICLGYYGPDHTDPVNYGNAYHWCDGKPSPPGSHGRLPWTYRLDLGVTYRPAFAEQKLAFSANVFNVFNEQRATFLQPNSEQQANTPNPLYGTALYREDPRYLRLSVSYDY
ncbi:MAG: TonB-dependent receptor plug domain-containing protein [Rhodanobacter sp.]